MKIKLFLMFAVGFEKKSNYLTRWPTTDERGNISGTGVFLFVHVMEESCSLPAVP